MGLTNIELYEELKKDVSERAARMIAEAVPKASELATKSDIAELREATKSDIAELREATTSDIAELHRRIDGLELSLERRFSEFEQRTFRYAMVFGAPLWAAMIAALIKFVLKT